MLDLEQISDLVELVGPALVGTVASEHRLEVSSRAGGYRFDMGDGSAMTNHREVLTAVLDRIEKI